jgi:hypothetical protein
MLIAFSAESQPGSTVLAVVATVAWAVTARWLIGYVRFLARVAVTTVASLSAALIAAVVLVVFALTG